MKYFDKQSLDETKKCFILCEFDRYPTFSKERLLALIPSGVSHALFVSLAHRIQGTEPVDVERLPNNGVAVFVSRCIGDTDTTIGMLTHAWRTLKKIVQVVDTTTKPQNDALVQVSQQVEEDEKNQETQDWESPEATSLIEKLLQYKSKNNNNRLPDVNEFKRIVKNMEPGVQAFVALSATTAKKARSICKSMEKKRKRNDLEGSQCGDVVTQEEENDISNDLK